MSVNSYLTGLASTLVLSEVEKSSISISINTLSSRLNSYFGDRVSNHFQFGSSTRGTILPRSADSNSDIDYMVVFNTSDNRLKPQTYLDLLKVFVQSKYSTSEIYQSHPTIALSLNHIKFELVPAIFDFTYKIPSRASYWSEWTNTDPSKTNELLQTQNKNYNSQIKPLVRLIKYWNTRKERPFTSFSIEQNIVGSLFWGCSSLKDFFYEFWAKFNYSSDASQRTKNLVDTAKRYAQNAKEYERRNQFEMAEIEIMKILPSL